MNFVTRIQKKAEKKFCSEKAEARHMYARLKAQELGFTSPSAMMKALGFEKFSRVMKNAPSVI